MWKEYDAVHQVTYFGVECDDKSGVIVRVIDMFDGGKITEKIGSSWESARDSAKEFVNSLPMFGGYVLN